MQRTERILIKKSNPNFKAAHHLCKLAKTIFNVANYMMRQSYFEGDLRSWSSVDKQLKSVASGHDSYQALPGAMSQAIIKKLGADWSGYFSSLKAWKKHPERFKAKPKPPGYAKHSKTALMPFQHMKCVGGFIHFPIKMGLQPIQVDCCQNQILKAKGADKIIAEIRFVPHGNCYWLEVVYSKYSKETDFKQAVMLDASKYFSIDLGINNLVTMISNQPSYRPVLINGKTIKSVNWKYNKNAASLRSSGSLSHLSSLTVNRFNWINDFLHKVSRFIINECLMHDVGTLVIGNNPGWKQAVNIGKVNNQKFVSIPHATLIDKILYKAEEYGIKVIVREESYSSKASALDLDSVPAYQKGVKQSFSGRRIKRGLYKTAKGLLLNADVNGALNILRKEIGDNFIESVANEGRVFRPVRVNLA